MNEWTIIGLLVAGTAAWPIGGTGLKWVRRFLWPALATGLLWLSVGWWALLVGATLVGVNVLPYGDRTPWALRVIVLLALMAPCILLSPIVGVILTVIFGGLLIGAVVASRTVNWFTWKVVEGLAGFLQAAALVLGALAR